MKPFYLTTTLPYVNAAPHIGFALEIVQADVIARAKRAEGYDVVFNFGTDEHGVKIYEKALEANQDPQDYVDEYAKKFDALKAGLNLTYTNFIRTTDKHHVAAAQEFWRRCAANGDIYKKLYKVKYCVGCELEKTDSELEGGRCPIHPNRDLEIREEENYFFRWSNYQEKLLKLYADHPDFVLPAARLHEIATFVEGGLQDFSISRLKAKMSWGIPVPDDDDHVMYVWFDALVNYISTLGWPEDEANFKMYWPGIQFAGKDNLRQQSAMWQAMLLSANLPPSRQIIIHGFITSGGQKMSKSLGNVVDPMALVETFGTDALRYWLLREMSPFEDGDFTMEKFEGRYEGDLANGLGNFASRVAALAEKYGPFDEGMVFDAVLAEKVVRAEKTVRACLSEYRFHEAIQAIWEVIQAGDMYVNETKPWETGDTVTLFNLVMLLQSIGDMLEPFLPETSEKIAAMIQEKDGMLHVKKGQSLFPRKEKTA